MNKILYLSMLFYKILLLLSIWNRHSFVLSDTFPYSTQSFNVVSSVNRSKVKRKSMLEEGIQIPRCYTRILQDQGQPSIEEAGKKKQTVLKQS